MKINIKLITLVTLLSFASIYSMKKVENSTNDSVKNNILLRFNELKKLSDETLKKGFFKKNEYGFFKTDTYGFIAQLNKIYEEDKNNSLVDLYCNYGAENRLIPQEILELPDYTKNAKDYVKKSLSKEKKNKTSEDKIISKFFKKIPAKSYEDTEILLNLKLPGKLIEKLKLAQYRHEYPNNFPKNYHSTNLQKEISVAPGSTENTLLKFGVPCICAMAGFSIGSIIDFNKPSQEAALYIKTGTAVGALFGLGLVALKHISENKPFHQKLKKNYGDAIIDELPKKEPWFFMKWFSKQK